MAKTSHWEFTDHFLKFVKDCSVQSQVMSGATNQYSDAGRLQPPHFMFSQRGRDRPLGQLSLAHTGSSAGQEGGPCKPRYHCVCVLWHFRSLQTSHSVVEMLWKLAAVKSTSCLLLVCAGDEDGLSSSSSSIFFFGRDGHLAATFID